MDFVVIGLGLSALALLTGLSLLCLVAPRWFRKAGAAHPGDAAYARAQAGARHALGQGFLCVGAVLLLTTFGGISAGLADKAGAYLIATMTTLAALGLFGWDLLYRRQHPVPARHRAAQVRARRAAQDPLAVTPEAPAAMSPTQTTTVRRRVLPARQRIVPGTQPLAAVAGPPESLNDDRGAGGEELPEADIQESPAGSAEPHVVASDLTTPDAQDHEPDTDTRVTEDMAAGTLQDNGGEDTDAGEHVEVEAARLEPAPLESAHSNGAFDTAAATPSVTEPDLLPNGDDRVIALFPTAAARRSRTIVAPTDPDGQS